MTKVFRYLVVVLFINILSGCLPSAKLVTDDEFQKIMMNRREGEFFHYIGSKGEYDYFVGEQWCMNSYPPAAKASEVYYKIKESGLVNEKMELTKEMKKWFDIRPKVLLKE